MKLISIESKENSTRAEIWLKAIKHLSNEDNEAYEEYNLILEVKSPTISTAQSLMIEEEFNKVLTKNNKFSVHTVAETIFPSEEFKKYGSKGVLEVYPNEIFPRIQSIPANRQGTYAQRIVRGFLPNGDECQPLDLCIKKLKGQVNNSKGLKVAFELPIDDITSIMINRNDKKLRGFPCLSHLSFKLSSDRKFLHLTAMYRSHDYIQKTLGNLLGLARLQSFIAKEVGIQVGFLVCHSTFARLDMYKGLRLTEIRKFIKKMEENEKF